VAKKFQCPCGYEDDNEANFNYHRQHCDGMPRTPFYGRWHLPTSEPGPEPEPEPPTPSFRLNKADKVMLAIIAGSFILYLLTLFW